MGIARFFFVLLALGCFAGAAAHAAKYVTVALDPEPAALKGSQPAHPTLVVSAVFQASDNADDDGWADTAETVAMRVELFNPGPTSISGVTLRLSSDDPKVSCITRSLVTAGTVPAGQRFVPAGAFEWIVAPDVQRTDAYDPLTAGFDLHIDAAGFPEPLAPQRVVVDLDLDATGGGDPTTYFESFENGFGTFTTMHLDAALNPPNSDLGNHAAGVVNADGNRCQYSDPDWLASASYGNGAGSVCYPNASGAPDTFYFATTTDRSFTGLRSLRWNVFLDEMRGYTTPTAQVEALRMADPVNLAWDRVCSLTRSRSCSVDVDCPIGESCLSPTPRLTIKHQASQIDHRSVNAQPGRAADRGVVAIQETDADDVPVSPWVKVYPYVNVYDSQGNSNYFACTFDPDDDGNDEGDFFDPTDPIRSHGPSSTCAPEFTFAHQGDTDAPFDPTELGDGRGPGLAGATGIGTWIEPAFDLSHYRGRRVRVRFLVTGRKLGGAVTWETAFSFNPDPGDDGWFIDDVTITDTLTAPATLSPDLADNVGLQQCADLVCGQSGGVEVNLELTPHGPTVAPGRLVEFDAAGSTVDVCLNGTLQYRLFIDVDGDETFDPGFDVLLRDWDYRASMTDAPAGRTRYVVEVRCESDPACSARETRVVEVGCPGPGDGIADHDTPFLHNAAPDRRVVRLDADPVPGNRDAVLYWTTEAIVDIARGDLALLRAGGAYGTHEVCAADNQAAGTTFVDGTATPNDGDGLFWLLRSAERCNDPGAGGSYGRVGEAVDRDTIQACPD